MSVILSDETLAEVLAEMRIFKCRNLETGELELCKAIANYFADRIEAAWKRESRAIATENAVLPAVCITKFAPIGNSAALREALALFIQLADDGVIQPRSVGEADEHCFCGLKNQARAALSAPPLRNCDRFADELDAQLAFLNEVWLISIDRETMTEQDTYDNWTDEMRTRYGRWLFAPSTEQGEGVVA